MGLQACFMNMQFSMQTGCSPSLVKGEHTCIPHPSTAVHMSCGGDM